MKGDHFDRILPGWQEGANGSKFDSLVARLLGVQPRTVRACRSREPLAGLLRIIRFA